MITKYISRILMISIMGFAVQANALEREDEGVDPTMLRLKRMSTQDLLEETLRRTFDLPERLVKEKSEVQHEFNNNPLLKKPSYLLTPEERDRRKALMAELHQKEALHDEEVERLQIKAKNESDAARDLFIQHLKAEENDPAYIPTMALGKLYNSYRDLVTQSQEEDPAILNLRYGITSTLIHRLPSLTDPEMQEFVGQDEGRLAFFVSNTLYLDSSDAAVKAAAWRYFEQAYEKGIEAATSLYAQALVILNDKDSADFQKGNDILKGIQDKDDRKGTFLLGLTYRDLSMKDGIDEASKSLYQQIAKKHLEKAHELGDLEASYMLRYNIFAKDKFKTDAHLSAYLSYKHFREGGQSPGSKYYNAP